MNILGRSWKTSLLGILAGGAQVFSQGLGWKNVVASVGLALLGLFSKDHNVTNGAPTTIVTSN